MNRRDFCRYVSVLGGSVILLPLTNACRQQEAGLAPVPTLQSTEPPPTVTRADQLAPESARAATEPEEMAIQSTSTPARTSPTPAPLAVSQIALVRTDDRPAGVTRALSLLGPDSIMGRDVLLKPNFNSADPSPGSTHPEILRALLSHLRRMGAGQITLADRSGMGETRKVMEQIGVFDLIEEFDFRVVVLDELAEEDWVIYRREGLHWRDGFPVPRLLLDTAVIVQTCNLKSHRYGGHFTLSLKNSVGFVAKTMRAGGYNYMTELHNSPHQRLMIAEINAAYEPDLIVMDGVEAFVAGGPAEGKRVQPGVILAGRDRVALDAVGVAILRMFGTTPEVSRGRVFDQEQIARAVELGLGATGPEQIELITDDAPSGEFAERVGHFLQA